MTLMLSTERKAHLSQVRTWPLFRQNVMEADNHSYKLLVGTSLLSRESYIQASDQEIRNRGQLAEPFLERVAVY